jgi:hypothetical protein
VFYFSLSNFLEFPISWKDLKEKWTGIAERNMKFKVIMETIVYIIYLYNVGVIYSYSLLSPFA